MTKHTQASSKATGQNHVLETAYMGEGASTYDQVRFTTGHGLVFHELELDQLELAIKDLPTSASILEVGCGTARFSHHLAKLGFKVTALDPSPDMLSIAKEKCAGLQNIEFIQAEGASLQFPDGTFDFVFAIRVINSTESSEYALATVAEMIRVARPEGRILVEFANSNRPFAKQNNSVRLSFAQLRDLANQKGCDVLRQSGVLVYSQTILNGLPSVLLGVWKEFERISARLFWNITSRGYILLKRRR